MNSQKAAEIDSVAAAILTRHEHQLEDIVKEIKNLNTTGQVERSPGGSIVSHLLHNVDHVEPAISPIEALLEEQKRETRLVLGFAIIVIPLVVAFMNKLLWSSRN